MSKKKLLSSLVAVAMLATMMFSACGQSGDVAEEELLTAEQKAAVAAGETASGSSGASGEALEGFDEGSTIGVSIPWLGTQNWVEAQDMFKEKLEAEGYSVIVEQADQEVSKQQEQISSMIDSGAKVIVVAAVDGTQLGDVLGKAKSAGVYILGYDRLIEGTDGIDGLVQFGSVKTGELQAQALLDGLAANKGEGPYNIELYGGGPADPNASNFFIGAMKVLQPLIDDGTLNILSNETDFETCATADWDNSKAEARMTSLLADYYSDQKIDGILCPNDGIARTCITVCTDGGQEIPVTSGLDAETESVKWVWEGKQYSTIAKPTDAMVNKTIDVIKSLQKGTGLPDTSVTTDNGVKDVLVYELPPVVVTKENAKEAFVNDPERSALLK